MVTVILRGGLGNQMFQYATGLNLAKRNTKELLLDTTFLNDRLPRKNFTYRKYDLDVFKVEPRFTRLSRISEKFQIPGVWLGLDFGLIKAREMLGQAQFIEEKAEHSFDPKVFEAKGNTILLGRWQNPRYLEGIENELREAFRFQAPLDAEAEELRKEIMASNSVALCTRRGDYVQFASVKKMMGDTNTSYYSRAVAYMNEHVKNPHYFVFADDVPWSKENIKLPPNTVYIGKLGPKWSYHLELMSLCKHAVITNSTFYWWGAWLNSNREKIVVSPDYWYAGTDRGKEMLLPEWVQLG